MTEPMTSWGHRVGLGGAQFSLGELDDEGSAAVIRAAYDAGVRLFDSARAYAPVGDATHNERLFAEVLRGLPGAVIATKGGHYRSGAETWEVDNSPARLEADVELSLKALGLDRIDLFYLHRADGSESVADAVRLLDRLRSSGVLSAIGLSNVSATQLDEALGIARVDVVQNRLSALDVGDLPMVRRCEEAGIAYVAYSPLGGPQVARELADRLPGTSRILRSRGISPARGVLSATLALSPAVTVIAGTRRVEAAQDSAAADASLWDAELAAALAADQSRPQAR
jgi:aryl-alcohol dehydrogenase-like predicted oxidoreductase